LALSAVCLAEIGAPPGSSAATYTVKPDLSGDYPTIQAAVDAAFAYDIIELTDGVFQGSGNYNVDYRGKRITIRSQSGDPESCIVDLGDHGGFYFHSGEQNWAVLQGITVRHGRATGGAVYCQSASPTISNMIFADNRSADSTGRGGALFCTDHASPILTNCTFSGNQAGKGGAVYCEIYSSPTLTRCTLYGNGAAALGGALYAFTSCSPHMYNTIIAFGTGGGVGYTMGSILYLNCCDLYENTGGDWGSGFCDQGGCILENPLFCDPEGQDFTLWTTSPCAPFSQPNPQCDRIGAWPVACDPPCSLDVFGPAEGEIFCAGDTVPIAWTSGAFCAPAVRIDLLLDGASCLVISDSTDDDGEYLWAAQACGSQISGYAIRVTDPSGRVEGGTGGLFDIESGCRVPVVYPNGGEHFRSGDPVEICWAPCVCCDGTVEILLVRDGGAEASIVESTPNDGLFEWTAEQAEPVASGYRVRVVESSSGAWDESNGTFDIACFRILSVADIPADQGRQVRVRWQREKQDHPDADTTVTTYSVWRRIDGVRAEEPPDPAKDAVPHALYPPGEWDYITTVPAHCEDLYSAVCPTLCDSTIVDGLCLSVFFVSAETADPAFYYATPPDSGYSVDNLVPATPQNLTARFEADDVVLEWDPNTDEDLDYYSIYRGDAPGFPAGAPIGYSIDPTFTDAGVPPGTSYWYRITATDFSGNESAPSGEATTSATDVTAETAVPGAFYLGPAVPNPFNPVTEIRFGIPAGSVPSRVVMSVCDAAGRQVVTLFDADCGPGTYSVTWDGKDHNGLDAASGVYFYRIAWNCKSETRRMVLLK
jgi:predicted outer membrane repeat protein